jgi:hypothetical protein
MRTSTGLFGKVARDVAKGGQRVVQRPQTKALFDIISWSRKAEQLWPRNTCRDNSRLHSLIGVCDSYSLRGEAWHLIRRLG